MVSIAVWLKRLRVGYGQHSCMVETAQSICMHLAVLNNAAHEF